MALLKKWRDMAYSETANKGDLQRFWVAYFEAEKEIAAYMDSCKNEFFELFSAHFWDLWD